MEAKYSSQMSYPLNFIAGRLGQLVACHALRSRVCGLDSREDPFFD